MERLTLLLVLISFVLNINARAFDNGFSSSSDSDEVKFCILLIYKKKEEFSLGNNNLSSHCKKSLKHFIS